jgi:single-strand DNA-binding protein
MARGFNKVILMGNLARDPEIRYTVDKRAWARFTIAVNRQWKGRNGELQSSADFIPVVVWGPQAENCEKFLRKGQAVLIEGRIQVRNYEDKSGTRRYVTEVVAQTVNFIGSRKSEGSDFSQNGSSNSNGGSIRDSGFNGDDFPLDFSEVDGGNDEGDEGDADIPF